MILLIGTYTVNTKSKGIYLLNFDFSNPAKTKQQYITAKNSSFLHFSSKNNTLYFVEELAELQGRIKAAKIDFQTLDHTLISDYPSNGSAPCHIAVSPTSDRLIVSNYSSGNLVSYAIEKDGKISSQLSAYSFQGNSTHPLRQTKSHIHSAFYTPSGERVYIQDLGTDCIYQFDINAIFNNGSSYRTHHLSAGGGPRHIAFSKTPLLYVLNELEENIEVYSLDKFQEINQLLQRISLNTDNDESKQGSGAQIRITNDQRFLYASNRGDRNHISVFEIQNDGRLLLLQVIAANGRGPRHFDFNTEQDMLFVTNQYSNHISIFNRCPVNGLLEDTQQVIDIPSPVFIAVI